MCVACSVTPGNFDTPMGALENKEAEAFKKYSALKRNGKPEEIAALFALLLDERLGFLTGADIIMDGGVIASGVSGLCKCFFEKRIFTRSISTTAEY